MQFFAAIAQQAPAGPQPGGGSPAMGFVPILLMVGVMYFLVLRPQSKKAKEHQEMLKELKVGERVWTQGGIGGKITGLRDGEVTLEISEKVRVRVRRSAITDKDTGDSKASEAKAS